MRASRNALGALILLLCCSGSLFAQSFTYQGFLKESGIPANGAYDFRFRLWSAAAGGSQVGSDLLINDLTVQNGLFTTELNFGGVWDGSERYLEIAVRPGSSTGAYTVLSPRVKVTRAPYAVRADAAPPVGAASGDLSGTYPAPLVAGIQGRSVSNTAPNDGQVLKWDDFWHEWRPSNDLRDAFWIGAGGGIIYPGNVGIGVLSPQYPLHVETSGNSSAICGYQTTSSGELYGVYGRSDSTSGVGVFGRAAASSGFTYGVYGRSDSSVGKGVYGYATATSGSAYGVEGRSNSGSGIGVLGYASATSGTTYGVYGRSDSGDGRGVYGYANATSGTTYGVHGRSVSRFGSGVYGESTGIYSSGVYGYATATSGSPIGVEGRTDNPDGHGVYCVGRFAATGTKSFQMDHPLNPENAYLNHFCFEGPEPQNVYNGVVVLDARGEAWVQLPDYFEAINRDPRYTLTPVGAPMPNLHVAVKIQGNRFKIAGGVPGKEVSWEVKAIRDDRWIQEYGYQTEQPKPVEHRGKYLHPELYGQPRELGIHYRPEQELAPEKPVGR